MLFFGVRENTRGMQPARWPGPRCSMSFSNEELDTGGWARNWRPRAGERPLQALEAWSWADGKGHNSCGGHRFGPLFNTGPPGRRRLRTVGCHLPLSPLEPLWPGVTLISRPNRPYAPQTPDRPESAISFRRQKPSSCPVYTRVVLLLLPTLRSTL